MAITDLPMRKTGGLTALILLLCIGYAARAQPEWSEFKWGHDSVKVDGQKAFVPRSAIFLPVSFTGDPRRYYLQLDLSSSVPILLYNLPVSLAQKNVMNQVFYANNLNRCYRVNETLSGRIGTSPFSLDSSQYFLMRNKDDHNPMYYQPPDNPIIGTVGLNFFLKDRLVLDFLDEQFMIVTSKDTIPYRFSKAKYYVPARVKNSRFMFPVQYGDTTFTDFFYETGSSIFDLVVSKKLWQKLTGKKGDEKTNFHVTVDSWGTELNAVGARALMPLRVNNVALPMSMVFYLPDDPDFKHTYGFSGMIGNSPFITRVIVLDFIKKRFGLFSTY